MTAKVLPFPDLFERVARYADQLEQSETLADRDSLTHAAELTELYESRQWVEEWVEEKPVRPNALGRPTQPDSRSRFAQWLAWRLEQEGHHALYSRSTYRLLNAHDVATYLSQGQISIRPDSERTIRPLDWLRKHKYQRFIPEVWARAVELADGDTVTSAHTQAALNEWKKANKGAVLVSIQSNRAERDRIKAQTAVDVLISHGDMHELAKFNDWVAVRLDKAFAAAEQS